MGWKEGWVQQSSSSAHPDAVSSKLQGSNIFTIAKRNVEGQDMLYQSLKLTNGIWILAELRIQPGNPNYTVRPQGCGTCWDPPSSAGIEADPIYLCRGAEFPLNCRK